MKKLMKILNHNSQFLGWDSQCFCSAWHNLFSTHCYSAVWV